ncbi:MAG: hypothetical protein J6S60_00630 [Oscillospiraceae bacterium]|nr:hypothetical protein [Oscillospiraceae bacterium]
MMDDFFAALVISAFDVDAAKKLVNSDAKSLPEIVNDILEEAGLDVAKVEPKPAGSPNR